MQSKTSTLISSLLLLGLGLPLAGCPSEGAEDPLGQLEPQVEILDLEMLTVYPSDIGTITFDYEVTGLEQGEGTVQFIVDDAGFHTPRLDDWQGTVTLEAGGWLPGWHRIMGRINDAELERFTNPGASVQRVFYVGDGYIERPEFLIIEPLTGVDHPEGEPLEVHLGALGFGFAEADVDDADDAEACKAPADCDPFDPYDDECIAENCPGMPVSRLGHVHLLLHCSGYAACSPDYEIELDPSSASMATGHEMTVTIPGDKLLHSFEEFSSSTTYVITATLHYGDHSPYPNEEFVISQEIRIDAV